MLINCERSGDDMMLEGDDMPPYLTLALISIVFSDFNVVAGVTFFVCGTIMLYLVLSKNLLKNFR
jgi:hypothetical protein